MANGLDIQTDERRHLGNAEKALAQAQNYLAKIELRRDGGDDIDQTIIDRLRDVIITFQHMTK